MMGYGAIIKKIRDEMGLNQRDFGDVVGISHATISRMEREHSTHGKEKHMPYIDVLKQICDKTNYDFKKFLEEAGYI